MILACTDADVSAIHGIINAAAQRYCGAIPADCWHEPYMSRPELLSEIGAGVSFVGWDESGSLIGVMGVQPVRDVTLIRHAYVQPAHQGRGIGGALLESLRAQVSSPILIGTWAAATWAIQCYERHGFKLVRAAERDALLKRYWSVSPRQGEVSVVLADAAAPFGSRRDLSKRSSEAK